MRFKVSVLYFPFINKSTNKNTQQILATVIDAWGKLPSGILTGNFFDFGSFDECFEVEINRDKSGELIHPQYCLGKVFSPSGGKQGVTRETLSHKFNHLPRMALLQP